jgi:pimeloyl-ACP methyl ester carboxylesterase
VADDGYVLSAFDLHLEGHSRDEEPQAWLFYMAGSEPMSVMDATGQAADFVAKGFSVVLLQPRGVSRDGTIDEGVFRQYETRERRVADEIAVLNEYLADSSSTPVLLVGSSQGGVVASEVAAADSRVTHLIMLGSGGGLTQAEELSILVEREPGYLGMSNPEELEAKFEEIRAAPDSGELWAGHPFRMWSSYLWFSSMDSLTSLTIPMFLVQGDTDMSTPVESARALRDEFERLGLTNLTYAEYPGLDHGFNDEAGENHFIDVQGDAMEWMTMTGLLPVTP